MIRKAIIALLLSSTAAIAQNSPPGDSSVVIQSRLNAIAAGRAMIAQRAAAAGATNGAFTVSNGQILDPSGNPFYARGINVYDSEMGEVNNILAKFPKMNFIRLNSFQFDDPSKYANFIQTATSKGIVVEIEDHQGISAPPFTGQQLQNESNWYAALANAYKGNPYVWFGTFNEVGGQNGGGPVSAQHQATYNAIRGTGNNAPILIDPIGGGNPDTLQALTASVYRSMKNVVWDLHQYDWVSGYSTDVNTIANALNSSMNKLWSAYSSADGKMPIISGEYGISTDGNNEDKGGYQLVQAIEQNTQLAGTAAWHWWSYAGSDNLTDGNGNLSNYGKVVANYIAQGNAPTPTPPPKPIPESKDGTIVAAGSSNVIGDSAGNSWGVTANGIVTVNGVQDGTTANVVQIAYVGHNVWQENNASLWWMKHLPSDGWTPNDGTSTSPIAGPTPPPPNPTPGNVTPPPPNTNAQPGPWETNNYNGMEYSLLKPANLNSKYNYPLVLALHQYQNSTSEPGQMDPWFNTPGFRNAYPAFVIVPKCPNNDGGTVNWGGVAAGAATQCEQTAHQIAKNVQKQFNTDPGRSYVTGNSMGGIGTWDMLVRYNAYTGKEDKFYAAGLSLAGADYIWGYPTPNADVVTALKQVPIYAIHGAQDTQVPLDWDRYMASHLGSNFHYEEVAGDGHDVWDDHYPMPAGNKYYSWMFAQRSSGTAPTPPTPTPVTPSPNQTIVKDGSKDVITDAAGNTWGVQNAQVTVNGQVDSSTARVLEIAYVNGQVWQENADKLWWAKSSPSDGWNPPFGTSTAPITAPTPPPPPSADSVSVIAAVDQGTDTMCVSVNGAVVKCGDAVTTTFQTTTYTGSWGANGKVCVYLNNANSKSRLYISRSIYDGTTHLWQASPLTGSQKACM